MSASIETLKEQADLQRSEAKRLLNSAFGWGEGITADAVDRAVDCIVGAAMLEICIAQTEAMDL